MAYRLLIVLIALTTACALPVVAQQKNSFALKAYPDLWYNTEDGFRIGGRVTIFQPLEYEDNHKLNIALSYATNQPKSPVSYYSTYRVILWPLYDLDEPSYLTVSSFSRTGIQQHGLTLYKRFTEDFYSENNQDLSIAVFYEDRFDQNYLAYPTVWQPNEKLFGKLSYSLNRVLGDQSIHLNTSVLHNAVEESGVFSRAEIEFLYQRPISFLKIRTRFSGFWTTGDVAPEHGLLPSSRSFHDRLSSPFFRAEGIMPQEMISNGLIQYSGGVNLRGYQEHEAILLENSLSNQFLFGRAGGFNLEIMFPNPIQKRLSESNITGAVLDIRTYLFADAGHIGDPLNDPNNSLTPNPNIDFPDILMDAGLGIAIDVNFPDFLGNRRGFILRYELPLWLSYPLGDDESLAFRQVIGFGGILRF